MTSTAESPKNTSMDKTTLCVAGLGLLGALVAVALVGVRPGVSVFLGSLIGAANLWAISKLVPRLMAVQGPKALWAVLSALKVGAVLAAVAVLVSLAVVDLLFLCLGYVALPLGIVVGQLWPAPKEPVLPQAHAHKEG